MPLLRIRERQFAVGCTWQPAESSHPSKREVERVAGRLPAVVLASRDGTMPMIGHARDVPPGTATLAGSLATASGSGIYILPMPEEGQVWACAVANGSVLNGFDMVGGREAVFEELRDLLTMYGPEAEQIPIRADYGAFPDEGEFGGRVEALGDISAFLDLERLALLNVDRSRQRMLIALGLVALLGLAAIAGTWIWTQKSRIKRVVGPTPEEIELANRTAWRSGLTRALSTMERFSPWPGEAGAEMWSLAAFEAQARWHFKGAECTTAGCNSVWEGGERALVGLLARRFGIGPHQLLLDPQGRSLTLKHPARRWGGALRAVNDADLERLPLFNEFRVRWHDVVALALNRMPDLRAELREPSPVAPVGVDPQNRPKAPMPEPLFGHAALGGREMASLNVALEAAARLDMAPKRLYVTPPVGGGSERNTWKMELEYVARR